MNPKMFWSWIGLGLMAVTNGQMAPPLKVMETRYQLPVQPHYLNLDTTEIVPVGDTQGHSELRGFSGHERLVYSTVGLRWGVCEMAEGFARLVVSAEHDTPVRLGGAIRHGGVDFEAGFRVKPNGMNGAVGSLAVSAPFGPAQKSPIVTVGLATERVIGEKLSFELNPRAALVNKNTIVGIGFGAKVKASEQVVFTAEWTPIVAGENTRSIDDGSRIRRHVFGFGLHISRPDGNVNYFIGVTNSVGGTTGLGLTPALGGTTGLCIGFRGRF